ncbi:MAG TPA: LEA type 2 family protein [Gammaproteobacteria bacterium]
MRIGSGILKTILTAVLLACIGLAPAACVSPRELVAPEVQLVGLSLLGATAEAQRFRVDLAVSNPNEVTIPIERLSFSVRLAGSGVMSGRSLSPFELASGASTTLQLEVTTNLVSSVSRLLALLQGPADAIQYDLDGLVTLSRGLNPTFPFSRRGEVPLTLPAGLVVR